MKKSLIDNFTVVGNISFPIDMLRYDACYPACSQDAARIENSMKFLEHGKEVTLRCTPNKSAPTNERWLSFGWKVTAINGAPVLGVDTGSQRLT